MKVALTLILLSCLGAILPAAFWAQDGPEPRILAPEQVAPPALRVAGNLLTRADGGIARLAGVNLPSLEWSNTGDSPLFRSLDEAIDEWRANAIRLPLNQDRWFGKANGQEDGGRHYREIVDDVVRRSSGKRCYVILDLHWSDAGEWGKNIGQHKMPDANSALFWKDAAARYANHPAVLFDLYNEPHDVTWDVWNNGGMVTEKDEKTDGALTYTAPGLQQLLDVVRATGAKNVVVASGLDWGYDLTGIARGHALTDARGNGVIYGTHIYPWKRDWDAHLASAAAKYPIFVGEVGCEPDPKQEDPATWAPRVLAYIEQHAWGWTAWCFHPSAPPRLLADWRYTPTTYWGAVVKKALRETRRPA
jgi:endoglucanase